MKVLVKDRAPRLAAGQREQSPKFSTSAFEKVGSSVIITDLEGKITYWNKRAEEMRGWKSEEVIGRPIFDVILPESRELANVIMKEIAKSGSWTGEFEALRKDTTRFQTISRDEPLEDWSGRVVGLIDVSVDITERKQIEKSLHDSEERFRGIAERSFDGIFTTDAKGVYTYVSPSFANLFGLDPSEMTGKSILERAHMRLESEPDQSRFLEIFKEVLSGKAVEASEFEIMRGDGSRAFIEANASPVFEGGAVAGVQAVVRDITKRRQAEDEINFQASLLNQIGRSVVVIDLAGIITYWNRQSEKLFGWKSEEVIGKRANEVLAAADPNSLREVIWKELLKSGHWSGELEVSRTDGTRFPALGTGASIKNPSGLVVGYSFVTLDITERKQMEKRLHDSEEKFRGIAERSFDGIFTLDSEGNTTYASPSLFKLTGFDPEEVEGLPLLKFLPESSISRVVEAMGKVFEGQTINNFEVEGRRKDGFEVLLEVNAAPVFDAKHSVTAIQGIARDVTELRRAEAPKKLLALIIESMPTGVASLGLDGTIVLWNPAAERIVGYSAKEMIGRPASILRPPGHVDEQTRVLEILRKTEGTKALSYEGTWVKKDGSQFDFVGDAFPTKDAYGKTDRFTLLFRDITAQKAAEEAGILLASVVESSPTGMMSIGMDGSITAWNPAAERIYGFSPKEVLGRPVSVLESPEDAADSAMITERLTKGEKVVHFDGVRPKRDGSLFNISVDAFLIRDMSGAIVGFSSFFSDVTAQKVVEEKVRSLQEARSRFISAATHELKTPLVSIKGYADLAVSGSLGEVSKPLEHGLTVIGRNVERMLNLIQELLEIERMENGQVEILKEVVDMSEVINGSVENLKPIIAGKQLEVDLVLPEAVPRVMGDKVRLDEVMDNLLVNAVKFTPEKGKLRVVLTEEEGKVCVSVADSGIGISPTNLQNLFEPFSKIPKSALVGNQEIFGLYSTGLGLALTKRLVELHGGRIWAESPGEGHGSTFYFCLPRLQQ